MAVTELHLQDRLTRLSLAPEVGASLVNWEVKATGQPLLRHSDRPRWPVAPTRRLACYPLAPWSNRIAEGGFARPRAGRHWHRIPGMTLTRFMAVPGSRPGR
jgi:aldose 1-epimerase